MLSGASAAILGMGMGSDGESVTCIAEGESEEDSAEQADNVDSFNHFIIGSAKIECKLILTS